MSLKLAALIGITLVVVQGARLESQRRAPPDTALPEIKTLVARLDLERYKATNTGTDAVRRPAAGHRPQSRGRRLDRGAAQELRLHQHGAHQVRVQRTPASQ